MLRSPITSDVAWTAADVSETAQWTTRLSPGQRAGIVEAARAVEMMSDVGHDALHAAFDFPCLRSDVADWVAALRDGRGFVLVRDFPVDELSPRQTELAYFGLGLP